jgi:TonB family protein
MFRVCVSRSGQVTQIIVVRSTGEPEIDKAWVSRVEDWKYAPYVHEGTPRPFCDSLRLAVLGQKSQPFLQIR